MKTVKKLREDLELSIDEATGNEIKKWFKTLGFTVKASKVGSKHVKVKSTEAFPNEFRLDLVNKFNDSPDIKNKDNVEYGNIEATMITLSSKQWDEVLSESVDLLEFGLKPSELKKYPALVAVKKEIDALLDKNKKHQYLPRKEADKLDKLEKKEKQIIQDLGLDDPSYKRAMTDSVNEETSKNTQSSSKHDIALGKFSKEGIAVIEQKGAKNKWQVVFKADDADKKEFSGSGGVLVRLETPLSKPGSWEHRTIASIDVNKGTIKFIDMDTYEDENVVKWEKGIKYTFLNILDTELNYFK
jgi:hypothetical protein